MPRVCPEGHLRNLPRSPRCPASVCLSETAASSQRSTWPERGEDGAEKTCPRSDVSHRRIRHYGIYHLLLAPRWNSTPRGPRGSSLCCPGSSPLTTTCPLAGLPPCLKPLLPQVLGFQSFSQALLWGKVFELTFVEGDTEQ